MNDAASNSTAKNALPIPKLLVGQKCLVTGANSGIGEAVAIAMGRAGADVAVNYVSAPEAAEQVVETIRGFGVKALAVHADGGPRRRQPGGRGPGHVRPDNR